MLEVPIDRIISVTDARNNFNKIVEDVEEGEMYVLTKGGNPSVALISVQELEKLTGNRITETKVQEPEVELELVEDTKESATENPISQPMVPSTSTLSQPEAKDIVPKPIHHTAPMPPPPSSQSFIQRNVPVNTPKPPIEPLAGPISTFTSPSPNEPPPVQSVHQNSTQAIPGDPTHPQITNKLEQTQELVQPDHIESPDEDLK